MTQEEIKGLLSFAFFIVSISALAMSIFTLVSAIINNKALRQAQMEIAAYMINPITKEQCEKEGIFWWGDSVLYDADESEVRVDCKEGKRLIISPPSPRN